MAPCLLRRVHEYSQGLVVAGGEERNGIEGILVGMVGKVVGSGGNVSFGIEGMVVSTVLDQSHIKPRAKQTQNLSATLESLQRKDSNFRMAKKNSLPFFFYLSFLK